MTKSVLPVTTLNLLSQRKWENSRVSLSILNENQLVIKKDNVNYAQNYDIGASVCLIIAISYFHLGKKFDFSAIVIS